MVIQFTQEKEIKQKNMSLGNMNNIFWKQGEKVVKSKDFGSREEDEVAGFLVFLHIQMRGYFRQGLVRLGLMSAPQGQTIGPARLEPPTGARKATVKIRRNPILRFFLSK